MCAQGVRAAFGGQARGTLSARSDSALPADLVASQGTLSRVSWDEVTHLVMAAGAAEAGVDSIAAMQLNSSPSEAGSEPEACPGAVLQSAAGSPMRIPNQPVNGFPNLAGQPGLAPAPRSIFSFNALTTTPSMPVLGLPAPSASMGAKGGAAGSLMDTPVFSPLPLGFSLPQPSPMLAGFDLNASPTPIPWGGSATASAQGRALGTPPSGQLKGLMLPPPTATSATDWGRGVPGRATAKGLPGVQPPATVEGLPPAQYLETFINRSYCCAPHPSPRCCRLCCPSGCEVPVDFEQQLQSTLPRSHHHMHYSTCLARNSGCISKPLGCHAPTEGTLAAFSYSAEAM